jgi:hypothetical protein
MTRNTLPLSGRHFHPCIGKALMNIERLSRRIGALCLEVARRDGRTAKCCYLHIVVSDAVIFGRFRCCKRARSPLFSCFVVTEIPVMLTC